MTTLRTSIAMMALMALSLAAPGWAQDTPPKPPKPPPAAPKKAPPPPTPPPNEAAKNPKVERAEARRRALLRKRVGLDEQKAEKVEAIVREHTADQRAVRQSVREARQRLRELLKNDSADEKAYEKALTDLESAHRSLQELRQKRFQELKKVLTPREQAKLLTAMGKVRRELRAGRAGKPDKPDKPPKPRRQRELLDPFQGRD